MATEIETLIQRVRDLRASSLDIDIDIQSALWGEKWVLFNRFAPAIVQERLYHSAGRGEGGYGLCAPSRYTQKIEDCLMAAEKAGFHPYDLLDHAMKDVKLLPRHLYDGVDMPFFLCRSMVVRLLEAQARAS